jgi:hypothetical protein
MTSSLKAAGTNKRKPPVEMSPSSVMPAVSLDTTWSDGEDLIAATSGHDCWATAMAAKSMEVTSAAATAIGR